MVKTWVTKKYPDKQLSRNQRHSALIYKESCEIRQAARTRNQGTRVGLMSIACSSSGKNESHVRVCSPRLCSNVTTRSSELCTQGSSQSRFTRLDVIRMFDLLASRILLVHESHLPGILPRVHSLKLNHKLAEACV